MLDDGGWYFQHTIFQEFIQDAKIDPYHPHDGFHDFLKFTGISGTFPQQPSLV